MKLRFWQALPASTLAAIVASAALPPTPTALPFETLQHSLQQATSAKDWPRALALAEQLNQMVEPEHVETLYTIARLHALLGHRKEAYEWLERANDAGLMSVWQVREDEAFAGLHEEEEFKKLTRAMWLKGYVYLLERKERDTYQKPEQVMQTLAFRLGERVADVGSGSGYFTVRVARAVGPSGLVWAVDIAQELLDYLGRRVQEEGLSNVRLVKVGPDDPQLPSAGVDTVLMVDTLHYIKERAAYAAKLRAALAPGGRVVVIDFIPKAPGERPWGPPPEQNMSRQEVDAAMAAAGLMPARVHDFLPEHFFVEYLVR